MALEGEDLLPTEIKNFVLICFAPITQSDRRPQDQKKKHTRIWPPSIHKHYNRWTVLLLNAQKWLEPDTFFLSVPK